MIQRKHKKEMLLGLIVLMIGGTGFILGVKWQSVPMVFLAIMTVIFAILWIDNVSKRMHE